MNESEASQAGLFHPGLYLTKGLSFCPVGPLYSLTAGPSPVCPRRWFSSPLTKLGHRVDHSWTLPRLADSSWPPTSTPTPTPASADNARQAGPGVWLCTHHRIRGFPWVVWREYPCPAASLSTERGTRWTVRVFLENSGIVSDDLCMGRKVGSSILVL